MTTQPAGGPEPKRILALDGGGVRGIVTIAFLQRMEALLREQLRRPDLVLADHFHLIGGTSVGSILATMLALGWPMERVHQTFTGWCREIFGSRIGLGLLWPKFHAGPLMRRLDETLGDMRLEDPRLRTGLAIVTKRLDTGSPWWIVTNNPRGKYWDGVDERDKNRLLRVADLVRASTAAPTVFNPQWLPLARGHSEGLFVDGGLTPFNNPSLALLMLARISTLGYGWPLGPGNLTMISIGTGSWRERRTGGYGRFTPAALVGTDALADMIGTSQTLSLALMQWLSNSRAPWVINSELGTLAGEVLGPGSNPGEPLLAFQRYDVTLEADRLEPYLGWHPSLAHVAKMRRLDHPGQQKILYRIATRAAEEQVRSEDFV